MPDEKKSAPPRGPMGGPGRGPALGHAKPKNFKGTFLRILGYLKNSRLPVFLILITLIIESAASIINTLALQPIINQYILPRDFSGLAKALAVLVVIGLTGVAATYIQTRASILLAQKTINIIRNELFDKLQALPLRYFDAHTHGELMSRFTNDADNVQLMLEQSLAQLMSSGLLFIGAIGCMLYLNPLLFIVTGLTLVLMMFLISKMSKISRRYYKSQQKLLGSLNGNIEETIGGLKEIKAFNHEEKAKEEFDKINREFQESATKANFYAGAIMPVMGNLNNVSYALVAMFGGILMIGGSLNLGALAAYLQFSRQVGRPIQQITNQMNNIFSAMAGAERIFNMMDEIPETDEGTILLDTEEENGNRGKWNWIRPDGSKIPLRGDVRFHDVYFSYDPDKPVLKNVSLYAKPGQMIAFVGSTGAGKTTITNLINRFYDVQEGSITYDGIDVREIKKSSLRRSLGMVLQDTQLFTATVMDNIRYGRLDATDEECVEAAKKASAHPFIKRLPEGYDTVLAGGGGSLSQGQRQLLAIARAYISQPPVMILDEATSSIDTRTEQLVQRGMNQLMEGRTVFVIAHRLSTVRSSKAIIVLEHGEIIERGDHEELLSLEGRYYQLHHGLSVLS